MLGAIVFASIVTLLFYLIKRKVKEVIQSRGEGKEIQVNDEPSNNEIRQSAEYREWRNAVLRRDNYRCIYCKSTKQIEAHHIYSFAGFPELRFDTFNGLTVCLYHHKLTPNYGYKQKQFDARLKAN